MKTEPEHSAAEVPGENAAKCIRILLADDHVIMREGLRVLIEQEPRFKVIEQVDQGRDAVTKCASLSPDVVIMDIGMEGLNGIEATRQIHARQPEVKILILSMHAEREYIARAFSSGASGYLLKECAVKELRFAIGLIFDGKSYISPSISEVVIEDYVKSSAAATGKDAPDLSDREREVLQLLAEGRSVKEIAGMLHVSVKTVHTHRTHLMQKLKMENLADLVRYAISKGITPISFRGTA
ncbi:MAG: response regulator transcription factor [Verrucomicrobiae bacterium]|nr:response regulator transcription factor [Verrucomicrobiae bacterium]